VHGELCRCLLDVLCRPRGGVLVPSSRCSRVRPYFRKSSRVRGGVRDRDTGAADDCVPLLALRPAVRVGVRERGLPSLSLCLREEDELGAGCIW